MGIWNEGFGLFIIAVLLIILVSIQLTLNKILKVLNELKLKRDKDGGAAK